VNTAQRGHTATPSDETNMEKEKTERKKTPHKQSDSTLMNDDPTCSHVIKLKIREMCADSEICFPNTSACLQHQ
jgi:hypothetical protein